MEEWRNVPGFNGKYQIDISTKEGRCRTIFKNHIRELSNNPSKYTGYIIWHLRNNGKETCQQAARWIAITYPELVQNEYFEGAEIDHIDTNTLNNQPSNLRWVDRAGQMNNPITLNRLREVMKTDEYKSKLHKVLTNNSKISHPVEQYTLNGVYIAEYPSIKEAERQTGIACGQIGACCRRKPHYNTAGGFIWKYKEEA